MTKKRTLDPEMIDSVAQNMFYALPLIKKRLLHMDMVQKEHGTPLSHVQVLAMLQDVGTMSSPRFPVVWHCQAEHHAAGGSPVRGGLLTSVS